MSKSYLEMIQAGIDKGIKEVKGFKENDLSDGYHTFAELYEFRKIYNALLFNEWADQGLYKVHKSTKHYDGEDCFGGEWFIVMAKLPTGQISNYYKLEEWDLFNCMIAPKALFKFDGHTGKDVLQRLKDII